MPATWPPCRQAGELFGVDAVSLHNRQAAHPTQLLFNFDLSGEFIVQRAESLIDKKGFNFAMFAGHLRQPRAGQRLTTNVSPPEKVLLDR